MKRYSEGQIRKRKGHWEGIVTLTETFEGPNGESTTQHRQVVHSLGIACSMDKDNHDGERRAKEAFREWRHRLVLLAAQDDAEKERGALERRLSSTVGEYATEYIKGLATTKAIERSTVADYRATLGHIKSGIGDVRLRDLTPKIVRDYEASLIETGLSPSTVGKSHRLLHSILEHAVQDGYLEKSPMIGVRPPKRTATRPNSLDAKGIAGLVRHLQEHALTPVTVAAAIALNTGAREGEICGLQWKDIAINGSGGMMWIRQAIGRGTGGAYLKATKTDKVRDAPITASLATLLMEWKRHRMTQWNLAEEDMADLYVLGDKKGHFGSPNRLCHEWKVFSDGWELNGTENRGITFHDLRHTFATAAIAGGVDVKTVSSILGHANAAITLNIYASADPDAKRRAALVLNSIIVGAEED